MRSSVTHLDVSSSKFDPSAIYYDLCCDHRFQGESGRSASHCETQSNLITAGGVLHLLGVLILIVTHFRRRHGRPQARLLARDVLADGDRRLLQPEWCAHHQAGDALAAYWGLADARLRGRRSVSHNTGSSTAPASVALLKWTTASLTRSLRSWSFRSSL
jgi:hypothetical protein